MLTPEQQAIRAQGIGGSEIGVLAGLSKWASPIDIYERKLGLRPEEESHHLERGNFLEPAIIRWYESRTQSRTLTPGTLRHPSLARVISTPDAVRLRGDTEYERVLEVKAPNHRTWHEWGEPGTDAVPASYIAQVQWEMACAGVATADVAAIIDGDLAVYTVAFDAELFGELAEIAHKFWRDHIETRTAPSPDGSDSYAESLARRFPSVRTPALIATPDLEALAIAYRDAQAQLKSAEAEAERVKQELQTRMGDAGKLIGSFGSVTWGECKGRESLDTKALKEAHPDIAAKFVRRGASYRRFVCSFKGAA